MSKNWMVLNFMKLPTVHYSSILVDEILRIAEDMEVTKFKVPQNFFPVFICPGTHGYFIG